MGCLLTPASFKFSLSSKILPLKTNFCYSFDISVSICNISLTSITLFSQHTSTANFYSIPYFTVKTKYSSFISDIVFNEISST